jgi:hypothetical protein
MKRLRLLEFIVLAWIIAVLGTLFMPVVDGLRPRPLWEMIPLVIAVLFGVIGFVDTPAVVMVPWLPDLQPKTKMPCRLLRKPLHTPLPPGT